MNQEILRGVPKNDEVVGLDMVLGLELLAHLHRRHG